MLIFLESLKTMLNSLINNRQQEIIVGNFDSNWISQHQGVPQGIELRHLIFNLYKDDPNLKCPNSCKAEQCANETLLFFERYQVDFARK